MPQFVAAIGTQLGFAGFTKAAAVIVTYAKAIAFVATIAASVAYNSYSQKRMQKKMAAALNNLDQGRDVSVRDPIAPRRIIYGQCLVGGTIVFAEVTGTSNEFLYLIVKLADHECHELGDVYFDDTVVPLDGSGNATGTYAGFATVRKYVGLAAGQRDTALETDSGGEWTSAHLGKSVARLHVKLKHNPDLYPQGIPNIRCLVKGRKVYDFRTTTTAYSNNPALCVADYLMDAKYGKGVAQARINSTAVSAAANVCDENVNLNPSGTEKRYTCNGVINSDEDPNDILASLADSMAGSIVDAGGLWTIHAGAYRTPTLTLTDDDLAGGFSVAPRLSRQDTFNGVRGTYYSPDNQWAAADFPSIINDTYKADDGGIRLWRDVGYRFTTSSATAQRLAKIELERGRQQIVVQARYQLKAMQCQPGDNIQITRARLGWTNKVFEVTDWRFVVESSRDNPALAVEITARETASGVWDWNSGEQTIVDLAPNTTLISATTVATPTGLTLSTSNFMQPDGTLTPRLRVQWTVATAAQITNGGFTRIEYKKASSSDWIEWSRIRGDLAEDYIVDVEAGVSYNVRIQFENIFGVRGAYASATATVGGDTTAPATPTGLAATVGTGKTVSLDWNDNTEADLGEYGIYRNTTNNAAGATKIAEVLASRFVDVDVNIGTAYWYWVTAIDRSENESAKSAGVSATPSTVGQSSVDTTAPATPNAPTFVSETTYLAGDGGVFSSVTVAAPALSTGAVGINILYRKSGASDWIIGAQVTAAGNVTIDDLSPEIAYQFAARAFSFSGSLSAVSSILSRTAPGDSTAPGTPTGLAATVGTGKAVSLDWNDNTEADLGEYGVYRNTTNNSATATKIAETLSSRFVDVDVAIGSTYYYWITAIDRSENESAKSSGVSATPSTVGQSSVDTTAPATPNAPTFVSESTYLAGDGSAFSSVTVAAPALSTGAVGINILYRKSGASDWIIGAQVTAAGNVTIDDLSPSIAYQFAARAFSFSGSLSAVSSTLSRTAPGDTTAPGTPTGLTATAGTGKAVSLDWSDNTEDDLAGYKVYRNTSNNSGTATYIASVSASAFTDASVAESTTYYYFISAYDRSGNESAKSSGASVTTGSVVSGATLSRGTGSSTIGLNSGSQTTIVTVNKSGSTFLISGNVIVENQDAVADSGVTVRVYRDSTVIYTFPNFNMAAYEIDGPVAFSLSDNPGSGTYDYTVKAYRTVSGATILVDADLGVLG